MTEDRLLANAIRRFLADDSKERFLRYVQVHTTSNDSSKTKPSTAVQWDLLRLLADECRALGLHDVHLGETGFVYATLPATPGIACAPFGLLAHVDTSPEQPGDGVRPVCHENWDGAPIRFPDDPDLVLTPTDSEELSDFRGDTIITASGRTLLGADDKAGVAEIMAALATLQRFPELLHGEIRACFTTDEEIGRGTQGIELARLPRYCYTLDGSYPGELETECFNAWRAEIRFQGVGVHPGLAKDKLVNAIASAARYVAELPEAETPERTAGRDGFYYVFAVQGDCENALVQLIVRDFEREENLRRNAFLHELARRYEERYPRLSVVVECREQYRNMRDILASHPRVTELAHRAIEDAGLVVRRKAIRGGTDGSLLSQLGHPTPNIFAGGLLFHSRKEWIAASSLAKAAETIVHLARRWTEAD
ncbi:MAG: peptidase T [Planctomycetota bacterium]